MHTAVTINVFSTFTGLCKYKQQDATFQNLFLQGALHVSTVFLSIRICKLNLQRQIRVKQIVLA